MAITSNKFTPVLGIAALCMVGVVIYKQMGGSPDSVKAGAEMKTVPVPKAATLPATAGADTDNPSETLKQVVASNAEMRSRMDQVLENNAKLMEDNKRLQIARDANQGAGQTGSSTSSNATKANTTANISPTDVLGKAIDSASETVGNVVNGLDTNKQGATAGQGQQAGGANPPAGDAAMSGISGAVAYKRIAPMGYEAVAEDGPTGPNGQRGPKQTRFVRTTATEGSADAAGLAAKAATAAPAEPQDEAYFTLPENATLVGVTAMTSLIGRIPIDGQVTDPMQFKAVIGRDNLAANGWELPLDIAGMIITGVAVGDMALSCNEGKIRSATFVFNDGTIQTISKRGAEGNTGGKGGAASGGDLGFISDIRGNPCIMGKFVTNAPAYLTDIVGLRTLGVAASAYADAQRQVTQQASGAITSAVTGSRGGFVFGEAVSGATDEVTKWMLQRLKNSFDAVVTPAGASLVVHLDQEIRIDKTVKARKIIQRTQALGQSQRGNHFGME